MYGRKLIKGVIRNIVSKTEDSAQDSPTQKLTAKKTKDSPREILTQKLPTREVKALKGKTRSRAASFKRTANKTPIVGGTESMKKKSTGRLGKMRSRRGR